MATNKVIVMNGSNFYPTVVTTTLDKVGEVKQMINGKTRFFHKAHKRKWELSWNKADTTKLSSVRTVYSLTSSFSLTDEFGNVYTVLCLPGGFKHVLNADSIGLDGQEYYDIDLTVQEA